MRVGASIVLLAVAVSGCGAVVQGVRDVADPLGAEVRKRERLELEQRKRQYEEMIRKGPQPEDEHYVSDVRNYNPFEEELAEGQRRARNNETEEQFLTREYADCVRRERERNPEALATHRQWGHEHPERIMCAAEWYAEEEARKEAARVKQARGTKDYQVLNALKLSMMREGQWNPGFVDVFVRACLVTAPSVQEVVFADEEFWLRWRYAREDGAISEDDYELAQMFLRGQASPEELGLFMLQEMREASYNLPYDDSEDARRNFLRLEKHLKDSGRFPEVERALNGWLRNQHDREYRYSNYDTWRQKALATRPVRREERVEPVRADPVAPAPGRAPEPIEPRREPEPKKSEDEKTPGDRLSDFWEGR